MSSLHDSALLAASSLGDGYLSGTAYPAVSRQRARSIGQSPLLGTHALDAGMAGEAARLGILPVGLGVDGLGTGNLTGLNEGVAAYAQPGVSPRFGPVGSFYDSPYDSGTHASESSNYNRLQALGLDGLGGSHLDPGYGASMGSRIRRDSLPFQY